jgi:hypothetical protein
MIKALQRPAIKAVLLALGVLLPTLQAKAETRFVDPANEAQDSLADGSLAHPFASLTAAFASGNIQPGDKLQLMSGEYGEVAISKAVFDTPVTISPAPGAKVHLTGLKIDRSTNLAFHDLAIWPLGPGKGHIVKTNGQSSGIVFDNLDIRSRADAEDYPTWGKQDWLSSKRAGILLGGPDNALLNSRFTGLRFAIGASGARARIEGNVVRGFSGDGARVLGDGSVFSGNRIEDCVQVDKNHADGFQSWSKGPDGRPGRGTVHGLRIENNSIREWVGPVISPLRCSLQGIGMFDGMYEDVIIRNNLVAVSAPHGITVGGGRRVEVTYNTVINNRAVHRKFPWLAVMPHKNKTPSEDVVIANNIATVVRYSRDGLRTTVTGNLTGLGPSRLLMDPAKGDFRARPGGPADGAADPAFTLPFDLSGQARGAKPDVGALESP